jgi:CRISPR system Cascade subunit CasB
MTSNDFGFHNKFVDFLYAMNDCEERGVLASLRRGLGKQPGTEPQMYRYVIPFIPSNPTKWEEEVYYIVGSLYAMHPMKQIGINMGEVFRKVHALTQSESVEKRFVALLNSHRDEVPIHLRHSISLAKSHDIGLDWKLLFNDLLAWHRENRITQRTWARSYWKYEQKTEDKE